MYLHGGCAWERFLLLADSNLCGYLSVLNLMQNRIWWLIIQCFRMVLFNKQAFFRDIIIFVYLYSQLVILWAIIVFILVFLLLSFSSGRSGSLIWGVNTVVQVCVWWWHRGGGGGGNRRNHMFTSKELKLAKTNKYINKKQILWIDWKWYCTWGLNESSDEGGIGKCPGLDLLFSGWWERIFIELWKWKFVADQKLKHFENQKQTKVNSFIF